LKKGRGRKNQSYEIIRSRLLEGKVDKKNVVLLMPRLWERKCEKKLGGKASIMGSVLSLDLGKKFDERKKRIKNK